MYLTNLKEPCAKCPFRKTKPLYLRPTRIEEICSDLRSGSAFPCHNTTSKCECEEECNCYLTKPEFAAEFCIGALASLAASSLLVSNASFLLGLRFGLNVNVILDAIPLVTPLDELDGGAVVVESDHTPIVQKFSGNKPADINLPLSLKLAALAQPQECYTNAIRAQSYHSEMLYAEGWLVNSEIGLPYEHACLLDPDGRVVDPTIGLSPANFLVSIFYCGKTYTRAEMVKRLQEGNRLPLAHSSEMLSGSPLAEHLAARDAAFSDAVGISIGSLMAMAGVAAMASDMVPALLLEQTEAQDGGSIPAV